MVVKFTILVPYCAFFFRESAKEWLVSWLGLPVESSILLPELLILLNVSRRRRKKSGEIDLLVFYTRTALPDFTTGKKPKVGFTPWLIDNGAVQNTDLSADADIQGQATKS